MNKLKSKRKTSTEERLKSERCECCRESVLVRGGGAGAAGAAAGGVGHGVGAPPGSRHCAAGGRRPGRHHLHGGAHLQGSTPGPTRRGEHPGLGPAAGRRFGQGNAFPQSVLSISLTKFTLKYKIIQHQIY